MDIYNNLYHALNECIAPDAQIAQALVSDRARNVHVADTSRGRVHLVLDTPEAEARQALARHRLPAARPL